LDASRLQTAQGKGASVSVSAAPIAKPTGTSPWGAAFWREPSNWLKIVILLAGIAAGLWVIARCMQWSWAAWTERRRRWRQSEAYAFHDLMNVCHSADARGVYRAFVLWRSRLPAAPAASAAPLAGDIEKVLFSGEKDTAKWSAQCGRAFAERLRVARQSLIRATARGDVSPLPPLNPASFGPARDSAGKIPEPLRGAAVHRRAIAGWK
jgi:hypothetical protein